MVAAAYASHWPIGRNWGSYAREPVISMPCLLGIATTAPVVGPPKKKAITRYGGASRDEAIRIQITFAYGKKPFTFSACQLCLRSNASNCYYYSSNLTFKGIFNKSAYIFHEYIQQSQVKRAF